MDSKAASLWCAFAGLLTMPESSTSISPTEGFLVSERRSSAAPM